MISWPTRPLPPIDRRNVEVLRATGAAQELEDRPHTYELESFAWSEDLPLRFIVRDEAGRRDLLVVEADGDWRSEPLPEAQVASPARTMPRAA